LMAQQQKIEDIVDIRLPVGTRKLTTQELKTITDANTKHPAISKQKAGVANEYYSIDSFTLELNGSPVKVSKNYLEDTKKGYDNLFKIGGHPCTECTSEIKKINNYTVLIIHQGLQDSGYYAFFSVDDKNSAAVNGILDYSKLNANNKSKALKAVYQILNGMTFK